MNESDPSMSDAPTKPGAAGIAARAGAVLFAVAVLVWLVVDAQRRAQARNPGPEPAPAGGAAASGQPSEHQLVPLQQPTGDGLLQSSKLIVLDPGTAPAETARAGGTVGPPLKPDPFLWSSKSGAVPRR